MKIANKVFGAVAGLAATSSAVMCVSLYAWLSRTEEVRFKQNIRALGELVSNTFQQLEKAVDAQGVNSLKVLYERERRNPHLTPDELNSMAKELGVTSIQIFGQDGRPAACSQWSLDPNRYSVFDLCSEYEDLFHVQGLVNKTPFLPSVHHVPLKLLKITNHNGTRILQVSIEAAFVAEALNQTISSYRDIKRIGLYSSSGVEMGAASSDGLPMIAPSLGPDGWGKIAKGATDVLFSMAVPASTSDCCTCVQTGLTSDRNNWNYDLRIVTSLRGLQEAIAELRARLLAVFFVSLCASLLVSRLLAKHVVARIANVSKTSLQIVASESLDLRVEDTDSEDEVTSMVRAFNSMLDTLRSAQARNIEAEKAASQARLAVQVAHDIRSPLAALNIMLDDLGTPPEEFRTLARMAISRIRDIANQLLYAPSAKDPASVLEEAMERTLLLGLVERVVTEKRIQYRSRLRLSIDGPLGGQSYGIFVNVQPSHLKRALSNLINNAVEAIADRGRVLVSISARDGQAILEVADDGAGMPPHVLQRLGSPNFTFAKASGKGIGVHHAKSSAEKWGGHVTYTSSMGKGTTVSVTLPLVDPPDWFLREIDLTSIERVVVLDDDLSVHGIWDERLGKLESGHPQLVHISEPASFRLAVRDSDEKRVLYLVDYELLGFSQTGLDLVEELNLAASSVLVTSRFEEVAVLERCSRLGVKLLPKPMAAFVPVKLPSQRAAVPPETIGIQHAVERDQDATGAWE